MDEHCKGLDAILQSGADEDVLVDASLLKEVDSRIKAVQEKSADRLLRLAYENSRSKILGLLDAGRKQLNIQPVKYASQAHVEKALKEYTVSIKWPASDVKMQILLTGPYALENLILGIYDLTWPICISCALGAPLSLVPYLVPGTRKPIENLCLQLTVKIILTHLPDEREIYI